MSEENTPDVEHTPIIETAETAAPEQVSILPAEASALQASAAVIEDPAPAAFMHMPPSEVTPQAYESNLQADEKVFALGTLGYDFLTEANMDYFQQAMNTSSLAQAEGQMTPSVPIHMAKFLSYRDGVDQPNMDSASALTWLLKVDNIPIYAIRPQNQFALLEFSYLVKFLIGQSGYDPEELPKKSLEALRTELQEKHEDKSREVKNPNKIDRISIAGQIVDEVRLYNGQVVPVVSPILRGMFAWRSDQIASSVLSSDASAADKDQLVNFLERVYYELRNRGVESSDRALNYAATNAYQAGQVFEDARKENLHLNKMKVQRSPVSRPGGDFWDVVMEFFDPENRKEKARKLYRYTVDVSEIMPITFGEIRSWYAY